MMRLGSIVLLLMTATALGAEVRWTGDGSNRLWTTPANWQDGTTPKAGDSVTVPRAGQIPLITEGMDIEIASLSVEPPLAMTGGTLTIRDEVQIGRRRSSWMRLSGDAKVIAGSLQMSGPLEIGDRAEFHIRRDPAGDLNPVMPGADPDVLLVGDTVWMSTTSGYGSWFYAYSSKDLVNWQVHGPLLKFENVSWMPSRKSAWAPGLAHKDGTFYLYYSAGPKPSHIGVATSDSPAGPFKDSGRALLSDNGDPSFEAIDAMVFTDPAGGTSYFYAGGSAGSRLRVFELNANMTTFAREIPVDNPPNFTEGAFMHFCSGRYYLSYSHGGWNSDTYSVHYATAKTPVGPWDYHGPILASDSRHKGPGHHAILHSPADDAWYIIYHRWNNEQGPGPYRGSRSIAIEKIEYDQTGKIKPIQMTDKGIGPVRFDEPEP